MKHHIGMIKKLSTATGIDRKGICKDYRYLNEMIKWDGGHWNDLSNSVITDLRKLELEQSEKILATMPKPETNYCRVCKKVLPIELFAMSDKQPSGIDSICIECRVKCGKINHHFHNKVTIITLLGEITAKSCGKCGQVKTVDRFYKSKKHPVRYFSWCKDCIRDRNILRK